MAKSVGLDIHERGVRAVELVSRGKTYKVTRYADYPLTARGGAPDPDELRDALKDIFKGGKFTKSHVICAVQAGETVVREIPVPFTSDDQIRKVVKYEAEHHLHDCDAEDVVVQYTKVSETADGASLLVFAARKEEISRRIEYAREAGVEPLAMDLDAVAFFNAAGAAGIFNETPNCVLMNIAHRSTDIIVVEEGRVRALRSVRMGVDSIVHALERDMDIEFDEAEGRLAEIAAEADPAVLFVGAGESSDEKRDTEKSHSELERDLFRTKRDELAGRLKREFIRSTAVLRGAGRIETLYVCGDGLRVPELLDQLGTRLSISVVSFQASGAVQHSLNEEQARQLDLGGTVAVGLALKGLGHDPVGLDFRREELKVANKFELLKSPLALTVSLLFVVLMAASLFYLYKKTSLWDNRLRAVLTSAFQSFDGVSKEYNESNPFKRAGKSERVEANTIEQAGPRAEALDRYMRELRRMLRKLEREFGAGENQARPITSALGIWNEIFRTIKENHKQIQFIDFKRIEITQEKISLKIVVANASALNVFVTELKKMEFLKGWTYTPPRLRPMDGLPHRETTIEFSKPRRGRG